MKHRLKILCIAVAMLIPAGHLMSQAHLLIYSYVGKGFVHDNRAASVAAVSALCREQGYVVTASNNPEIFSDDSLKLFNCIIFCNTNNESFTSQAQRDAFQRFIRHGGGFVGIHSATTSEKNWPWFVKLVGGSFLRHPKLQPFTIKTVDHHHPSTAFMDKSWEWEDECYQIENLNPDMHVLLVADLTTVQDSAPNGFHSEGFGDTAPLAWYSNFEGSRQFQTALGHKIEYYSNPLLLKHILGGIQWVLAGK